MHGTQAGNEEMQARKGDQVHGDLIEINVQGALETHGASQVEQHVCSDIIHCIEWLSLLFCGPQPTERSRKKQKGWWCPTLTGNEEGERQRQRENSLGPTTALPEEDAEATGASFGFLALLTISNNAWFSTGKTQSACSASSLIDRTLRTETTRKRGMERIRFVKQESIMQVLGGGVSPIEGKG